MEGNICSTQLLSILIEGRFQREGCVLAAMEAWCNCSASGGVMLTGIEPAGHQFSSVQFGL
jgi:hypothetical protein